MAHPLADTYRRFAEVECGDYAPHYRCLSYAVADDENLLGFLAELPETQPNLFFAAVQYLAGPAEMPADAASLRAFVERHSSEIASLMRTRRTQTNEIGRCASLLPALPRGPLALIEIGASAGLCLQLDRLRYEYGTVAVGDPSSPVLLRCSPIGDARVPIPDRLPDVRWRRGLDLAPVDPLDPDDARWLLACVWTDHIERRERLEAALALALREPVVVERGDLVRDLPGLLERAPADATVVVFHSATLTYVDVGRRAELEAVLARHSHRRDVVWISNEGPGVLPDLESLAPARLDLRFRVARTTFSSGARRTELLALTHPHGRDLEWLSAPSASPEAQAPFGAQEGP